MFGDSCRCGRVVDVPGVSMEPARTHVANTAEIGLFKIGESGPPRHSPD